MTGYTTSELKAQIVVLKKQGYSNRAVASTLGSVSQATVGRIWTKYGLTDRPFTERAPIPGRPHKLTFKEVRFAALALLRNKPATAATVKQLYFPHICASTLCRYLKRLGLRAYRRRRVPFLNQRHKKARRTWSHLWLFWLQSCWDDIVFSDEVRIELFGADSGQYYWRFPKQSPYDPRFTKKTISHGGGGIFVWGCITHEGVGRLYHIDGTLTAVKYIEILRDGFFGTLADYRITPFDIIFQHDRDPKHTALLTQRWLQSRHINVLPWPAKSPDLNIIEHVWWYLKQRVCTHEPPASNKEELWCIVQKEWRKISPEYIANLYDSMPHRVLAVYDAKGGNTCY
ncbi:hypothetical protein CTheo_9002 [Ceratobasidium theobromae]|uniref:Transposable element Tcb2 transposase n=1 Tax=Ceratobasidium theobromae TaxID=1582974 RepID=A0A5N5Q797_9AGAM|nr:hypothetical protein CTheo_9002 [Ceratobasidium theobromae]